MCKLFKIEYCGKYLLIGFCVSLKIEKQILEDEFDDPEFLEFAIKNYSEIFGYIATGRIKI